MSVTRRKLLTSTLAAGAAALAGRKALAQPSIATPPATLPPPRAGKSARKLVVPNGSILPWTQKNGAKVYHLRAEPVKHTIAPGLDITAWGYNGSSPGPVIEAIEGDRVRIYVTNKLPEATSVHWHGIFVPHGMDGVSGLTQAPIEPGKTFKYEFVFDRAGTFMYHPHLDEMTQIALGMMGVIVVHPRGAERGRVRDYVLMSHEMKIPIGSARPDPMAMNDFNVLTFNGKSFPATEPLVAEVGDLVRIRLANLGPMDHHPIHLHGHAFEVVATDGGPIAPSARVPETTVLVPVGTTRTIEFTARAPGDWAMHCHMTHHAMNQMGHDTANLVGADTRGLDNKLGRVVPGYMTMGAGGMAEMSTMQMPQPKNSISMVGGKGPHGVIDMGGMFTILKIRDKLKGDGDPGWYDAPKNTTANEATDADLARDGIEI
ncbi:MAG: copper oxidase [Kofleriaceae bacterium]|nr:copper oxidase [Kofleriaceae bacterium]